MEEDMSRHSLGRDHLSLSVVLNVGLYFSGSVPDDLSAPSGSHVSCERRQAGLFQQVHTYSYIYLWLVQNQRVKPEPHGIEVCPITYQHSND